MQYLSGLVALLVAVVGWYINAVNRNKQKMEALEKNVQDLNVSYARLESRSNAHDGMMNEIKQELGDVRDNMVRRHDLEQIFDSISKRIDDALASRPNNRRK